MSWSRNPILVWTSCWAAVARAFRHEGCSANAQKNLASKEASYKFAAAKRRAGDPR